MESTSSPTIRALPRVSHRILTTEKQLLQRRPGEEYFASPGASLGGPSHGIPNIILTIPTPSMASTPVASSQRARRRTTTHPAPPL
ncbi:Hypothetical protein FKW44_008654 [Caligus rogercresseyi]|uniref:Uncharacterized protein n=1 Tax=Caligus rogercresseyi TaxID=217165 RepID=A0A7T8KGP5_CALRO|nr:Hypothetical protein FKW44_008654 [Caligus rogercresseyi]